MSENMSESNQVYKDADQTERAIIERVFMSPLVLDDLADVTVNHFTAARFRFIWAAITELAKAGTEIEPSAVIVELERTGKLDAAGGAAAISELAIAVGCAGNIEFYAERLRESHARRTIARKATEVAEMFGRGHTSADMLDAWQSVGYDESARGSGFIEASERVDAERAKRLANTRDLIRLGVPYLDDRLMGLTPDTLMLVGGYSGIGKTELMTHVAESNISEGRQVYGFFLEASEGEIERRIKYRRLADMAYARRHPQCEDLSYQGWYKGQCEHITAGYDREVTAELKRDLRGFHTFYRGVGFTIRDLESKFAAIRNRHPKPSAIIFDHFHYIDAEKGKDANSGQSDMAKRMRDTALSIGVPVICVVHLRKPDRMAPRIIPTIDDVHGAADLTRIATDIALIGRGVYSDDSKYLRPTYMQVVKNRAGGADSLVALADFDVRTNRYAPGYRLGKVSFKGDEFEPLDRAAIPRWAKNETTATETPRRAADGGRVRTAKWPPPAHPTPARA